MTERMGIRALLVGATGLVGGECLRALGRDDAYDPVVVLTRRPLPVGALPAKVVQHVVAFDHLGAQADRVRGDHVFCALGTTMKKAGSKEAFRRVDFEYPYEVARIALRNGARHFSLVSSLGANPDSRVFYSRVKGELEEALRGLGYTSLSILRPSVIGGSRQERRPAEALGRLLLSLAPRQLRTVAAADIARAMVALARAEQPGVRVVESAEIREIARG